MHARPWPAALLVVLLWALASAAPAPAGGGPNPVRAENARPGDAGAWSQIVDGIALQGYASQTSVLPGGALELHVSGVEGERYRVEVYRLGWYGGAGARRLRCGACSAMRTSHARPTPAPDPSTGEVDAGWPASVTLPVPRRWVSGYYLAKLVAGSGPEAGAASLIPFIVREPPGRSSRALVIAPVNTWQAYNGWGGKSLYAFNSSGGVPANRVSFNRPVGRDYTAYELQLVSFLERQGYDVSYATDVDVDRDPGLLRRHTLVITAGHGEYWSSRQRDAFDAAKAAGVNLAFMGANTGYWQIRYENGGRTVVGYKHQPDPIRDPRLQTVRFRDFGRPECRLQGVQFEGGAGQAGRTAYAYTVPRGALPWMRGSGLAAGSVVEGVVGYEYDTLVPGCVDARPVVLFNWDGTPPADAVAYAARSGSLVFSAGSLEFSWALDDRGHPLPADPRVQRFARNMLADLLVRHRPPRRGGRGRRPHAGLPAPPGRPRGQGAER